MNNEWKQPDFYYWKLIAERSSTGSEILKFVEVPASIGKMEGLRAAMIDFRYELGPAWSVTHQALSPQYYAMRKAVLAREEAMLMGNFND